MIGVYKIIAPDGKVYIGATKNIKSRFIQHRCNNGFANHGTKLDQSFFTYGAKSHKFKVIEECLEIELPIKERYWQDCYNVLGANGLNCKLTRTPNLKAVITSWITDKLTYHANKRREYRQVLRSNNPNLLLNFSWTA